ncbi:CAAX prenyl protease 1 [Cichlidogyrus casuarinus]|uniref:CAAX prenyl protease 1 n=1 Tax=Cichlidogyrus casuarinus TaxID=1844966 RepID=A0ABD2QG22_9PLAT
MKFEFYCICKIRRSVSCLKSKVSPSSRSRRNVAKPLPDDARKRERGRKRSHSREASKKKDVRRKKKRSKEEEKLVQVGDTIHRRYDVNRVLGEGSFGHVLQCDDRQTGRIVAVKAIKPLDRDNYRNSSRHEMNVLVKLNDFSKSCKNSYCIEALEFFEWNKLYFIVFPKLGDSVFNFIQNNKYQPFSVGQSTSIVHQLCSAVKYFNKLRLCHTDLKPENILFVDSAYEEIRQDNRKIYRRILDTQIKVIDFGSATFEDEHHSRTIQTRHYRAPEVVLELGWSYPADVWSIGCILYELLTGKCMFMTHDNLEHLAMMERIIGPIPKEMIRQSPKTSLFYKGRLDWNTSSSDDQYVRKHLKPLGQYWFKSFDRQFRLAFDLIREMLVYQPCKRLHIQDAFSHPFLQSVDVQC